MFMLKNKAWLFTPVFLLMAPASALAATTVTGILEGPHGEHKAAGYTVKNRGTGAVVTSGTTGGDGSMSISLNSGDYTFTFTPDKTIAGYEYTDEFTIPFFRLPDDAPTTIDMGYIRFPFRQERADSDLEDQGVPSFCTAIPQSGAPTINRVDFQDKSKGAFLYTGRDAGVEVRALGATTVYVDYGMYENDFNSPSMQLYGMQEQGATPTLSEIQALMTSPNIQVATDAGSGLYVAHHTIQSTAEGGGLAVIVAVNGSGQYSFGCTESGPVNLDIRDHGLNGADTTIFDQVQDFRSISNFTMHVDGFMKITMKKAVNMQDSLVQNFFKSIADKLETAKGKVSLDLRALGELREAGAEITLYNINDYLSEPEILLDGSVAGSAVSGVTYNRSAHTLTFAAAHFSQYTAVPKLTFTSPANLAVTSDEKVTVTGSVNDASATVKLYMDDVDQGAVTVASNGTFSKEVTLTLGAHTLRMEASNSVGSAVGIRRAITRQALPVTGLPTAYPLVAISALTLGLWLTVTRRRSS